MSKSSTSSSWALSFVLGAMSALSLVWLSNRASSSETKSKSKTTTRSIHNSNNGTKYSTSTDSSPSSTSASTSTSSPNQLQHSTDLMDAADLDQRMLRKAEAVIQWRTSRLILVIERCTNDHNYSAILRTAEALGIQTVYMIDPPDVVVDEESEDADLFTSQHQQSLQQARSPQEIKARRMHHLFAQNALEWLTVRDFSTTQDCVAELKSLGYELWVTDLSQHAESLSPNNPKTAIPEKVALVMGTEAVGCSQYMLEQADLRVYLPLRGFADSLNLSVATALIVHEMFTMDPTLIGGMSPEDKKILRREWFTKLCQQRLLTSSQKKTRQNLMGHIRKCQSLYERTQQDSSSTFPLQPSQQKKLAEFSKYKEQLAELDALLDPAKIQAAVQDWVDDPPSPLTDVRRADNHRVCYVGKNTRKNHDEHWKDMVAVSKIKTVNSTAVAFRQKVYNNEGKAPKTASSSS